MQDRDFLRPIAELRVALFSSRANDSALHRACTELLVQLCHDALTETVYMAALCELGSSIESSEYGIGFRVNVSFKKGHITVEKSFVSYCILFMSTFFVRRDLTTSSWPCLK